jgi:hypothetical protein
MLGYLSWSEKKNENLIKIKKKIKKKKKPKREMSVGKAYNFINFIQFIKNII